MPGINTVKHYVQYTNAALSSGIINTNIIAEGVINTALPVNTHDIKEGSNLYRVYLELWLKGTGSSDGDTQFNLAVYRNPSGDHTMIAADLNNLMAYSNKKNIMFASQGVLSGAGAGQSVAIIRQWIKIPKGKRRFGPDDTLEYAIMTTGTGMQRCGLAVYKEFQ